MGEIYVLKIYSFKTGSKKSVRITCIFIRKLSGAWLNKTCKCPNLYLNITIRFSLN